MSSSFDSWKNRITDSLSDSLQQLPSLDDMAKNDEYVHSSEFRVSRKQSNTPMTPSATHSTTTSGISTGGTNTNDTVKIPTLSLLDEYPEEGEEEKDMEEKGWDAKGSSMSTNNSNARINSMISPTALAQHMGSAPSDVNNQDSTRNQSSIFSQTPQESIFKDKLEKDKDEKKTTKLTKSVTDNDLSVDLPIDFLKSSAETNDWSLLDTMIQKNTLEPQPQPETKTESLSIQDDEESATIQTEKPTKKEFVPLLSVMEALKEKDTTIPQFKYDNLPKIKIPEALQYESDDSDSDDSINADFENDFVLDKLNQAETELNLGIDDDMKMLNSLHSAITEKTSNKNDQLNESKVSIDKGRNAKPAWFDVFDDTNNHAIINEQKSLETELIDEESNGAVSFSDIMPRRKPAKEDKFKWFKDIAPQQLQSVSKNVMSKWKEHKIGEKIRTNFLSNLNDNNTARRNNLSSRMNHPEETKMLELNENEYVVKDSNALLAQDDLAEWENIKARSSSTLLTKLYDFWDRNDDYLFVLFTLFLMTFVYFYVNHGAARTFIE